MKLFHQSEIVPIIRDEFADVILTEYYGHALCAS